MVVQETSKLGVCAINTNLEKLYVMLQAPVDYCVIKAEADYGPRVNRTLHDQQTGHHPRGVAN